MPFITKLVIVYVIIFGAISLPGQAPITNYVPKFSNDSGAIVKSTLFETPQGNIGLNTQNPAAAFHVVSNLSGSAIFQRESGARFTFQNNLDSDIFNGALLYVTDSTAAQYRP